MRRNRHDWRRKEVRGVAPRQRDVLCDVMLAANDCETWLTLHELARLTHYGEASISAQLRHLRKPRYGAFVVDKRRREVDEVIRGEEFGPVWEYRLRKGLRVIRGTQTQRSGPAPMAASTVVC